MITNDDRIQWLVDRVAYLEHKDQYGTPAQQQKAGGWWPQVEDDVCDHEEGMTDLSLIEYIDAQINWERK